jgi:hypothetical protein
MVPTTETVNRAPVLETIWFIAKPSSTRQEVVVVCVSLMCRKNETPSGQKIDLDDFKYSKTDVYHNFPSCRCRQVLGPL